MRPDNFQEISKEPLKWEYIGAGGTRTINSKDWEPLKVGELISSPSMLAIYSEEGLSPARCYIENLEGKKYRGKIHVTAANASPVEKEFEISAKDGHVKLGFNES